ncbi:hypothetical protein TNCV_745631 [Trichonephila clavipes]|nr:hypothetical protein TNCV_745631 [Trichonephila clavipes]
MVCHSFQSGRQAVKNRNIAENGRPSTSTTEINTERGRSEDNYLKSRQSYGSVQHIVSVLFGQRCENIQRVMAQWTST